MDTTSSPIFSALLRTNLSTNETTAASMEQMFFNIRRLKECKPHIETERWRGRSEQPHQSLARSVKKFVTATAPASNFSPIISQYVSSAICIFRKRTNHYSDLRDDPESAPKSLDEECILPVDRPQKRRRRASFTNVTQVSTEMTQITSRKYNFGHRNNSVTLPTIKKSLFEKA